MDSLDNIRSNYDSYQKIISFYQKNKEKSFKVFHVELHGWFSANMSAVLGSVLDLFINKMNVISFDYIDSKTILQKNNFLSYFGQEIISDLNNTTIKYKKIEPTDGRYFKKYVIDELVYRNELPKMSSGLKEKIIEAIYEIFVNAQIHSYTKNIYTCGQFFPKKNKIEFTIVDTGIGFRENIYRNFKKEISATQAICWAVQDRNTTKTNITGGIGLAFLKEFISINKGKMQIISDQGFFEYDGQKNKIETKLFEAPFPGTIVNLQFCTDDPNNYSLKEEINNNDIF